jgi:hypothetical protein
MCVAGVHPLSGAQAPRTIVESAVPPPTPTVKTENVRSVILDPKNDVLVLDDLKVSDNYVICLCPMVCGSYKKWPKRQITGVL